MLEMPEERGTHLNKRYAQPGNVLNLDETGHSLLDMPSSIMDMPSVVNESAQLSLQELARKYKNKNDLYRALRFKAQVYLPNEFYCSYEFL